MPWFEALEKRVFGCKLLTKLTDHSFGLLKLIHHSPKLLPKHPIVFGQHLNSLRLVFQPSVNDSQVSWPCCDRILISLLSHFYKLVFKLINSSLIGFNLFLHSKDCSSSSNVFIVWAWVFVDWVDGFEVAHQWSRTGDMNHVIWRSSAMHIQRQAS